MGLSEIKTQLDALDAGLQQVRRDVEALITPIPPPPPSPPTVRVRPGDDHEAEVARVDTTGESESSRTASHDGVIRILVEREADGRYFASWERDTEAGCANYASTVVGALAELCATLLKVDEDKAVEQRHAPRGMTEVSPGLYVANASTSVFAPRYVQPTVRLTADERTDLDEQTALREAAAALTVCQQEKEKLAHRLEQATSCAYEICGCAGADDGHCMMCCQPLTQHRLIPKSQLAEIEERLLEYSTERKEAVAALGDLRQLVARLRALVGQWRQEKAECYAAAVINPVRERDLLEQQGDTYEICADDLAALVAELSQEAQEDDQSRVD